MKEGVVAKGVLPTKRKKARAEHGLWMAKAKTKTWFDELQRRHEMSTPEERGMWKRLLDEAKRDQGI